MKAICQLVGPRFWGHLQGKECREFGMSLTPEGVKPVLLAQAESSLQAH